MGLSNDRDQQGSGERYNIKCSSYERCETDVTITCAIFVLQALNNLQSTCQGFVHVNSENVFKVTSV